jgi:predicted ATPase
MSHEAAVIVRCETHGSAHHKREGVGTGQALLDRTYASLGGVLRVVLRRLAVFAGGFTPGSAGAVANG